MLTPRYTDFVEDALGIGFETAGEHREVSPLHIGKVVGGDLVLSYDVCGDEFAGIYHPMTASAELDLSYIVCGSAEWGEFVDEWGFDPTDLSEFRDRPDSPAVTAYTGVPASVLEAPERYNGPNREQVRAVLRTWRAQARRIVLKQRFLTGLRQWSPAPPPLARASLAGAHARTAPGRRHAAARAPSSAAGDDPPPAGGGLTAGCYRADSAVAGEERRWSTAVPNGAAAADLPCGWRPSRRGLSRLAGAGEGRREQRR